MMTKNNKIDLINLMSKWDYNMNRLVYYKNKYKKHHGLYTNIIITYLDL